MNSNLNFKTVPLKKLIKDKNIYPIKFDFKNRIKKTSLKNNKEDIKYSKNFKIAPGIKIFRLCTNKQYEKVKTIIETIFEENYTEKSKKLKNGVVSIRYCPPVVNQKNKNHEVICLKGKEKTTGVSSFLNNINVSEKNKEILYNFTKKICKIYIKDDIYEEILKYTSFALFRYKGEHKGLKLHIDNIYTFQGPIFIFNLGTSVLDFIPYNEIMEYDNLYRPFRIKLNPNQLILTDGDSRYSYTHGIPEDISNKDTLRYAIVIRFPVYFQNKKLCKLTDIIREKYDEKYFIQTRGLLKVLENSEIGIDKKFKKGKENEKEKIIPCYSDTEKLFN